MSKNRTKKNVTMQNRISTGSNNEKEQSIVRIWFENFINDLFATLNYPEWPASSFLLKRLNAILTNNISDQEVEHSVRLLSMRFFKIISTKARCCLIEYHHHRHKMNELDEQFHVEVGMVTRNPFSNLRNNSHFLIFFFSFCAEPFHAGPDLVLPKSSAQFSCRQIVGRERGETLLLDSIAR